MVVSLVREPMYREAPWRLRAEWIIEEGDLHAAHGMRPGSTLGLLRWPVAFFVPFVASGVSDARVGATFAICAASVISVAWIVLSLATRGTSLRKISRLPKEQRASHLTIDGERIRYETGSGHAAELPFSDLTHAKVGSKGILLDVRGQAFFVPARAIRGSEAEWQSLAARLPAWPRKMGFTIGLWLFAGVVAAYALLHGK